MHAPLSLTALLLGGALAMPYPTPAPTCTPTLVDSRAALAPREYELGNQPYFPGDIPSCVGALACS